MLECCCLLNADLSTKLSVLSLLKVGKHILLSLTTLEVTILLWVHSKFEEFLVVLSIFPTVLVHLLLEVFESVRQQGMRINLSKLKALLSCKFLNLWSNLTWHLTTLTKNHTPDRVIHHYVATLTLLKSEKVEECNVLCIL